MSLLSISAAPYSNDDAPSASMTSVGKPIERKKMFNKTYKNHGNSHPVRSDKVNSVLMSIHNRPLDADEDDDLLENFESANYSGAVPSSFRNPYESIYSDPHRNESGGGSGRDTSIVREKPSQHSPMNPFANNVQVPPTFMQEGMQGMNSSPVTSAPTSSSSAPLPVSNDALQLQELRNNFAPKYDWNIPAPQSMPSNPNIPPYLSSAVAGLDQGSGRRGGTASDAYHTGDKTTTDKLNYIITLLEEQQDQRTNHVTEEIVLYSFLGVFMIFIVDSFVRVGKYVR